MSKLSNDSVFSTGWKEREEPNTKRHEVLHPDPDGMEKKEEYHQIFWPEEERKKQIKQI